MFSDSQAFGRAHIIHEFRARVGWLTKGRAINQLWHCALPVLALSPASQLPLVMHRS
ncbi:hypothetical protein RK21_01176 [Pseudomonas plecoglossicida]|nr:hypothetical protein RK21_01176 [Pseudomonas plecoglossicida]